MEKKQIIKENKVEVEGVRKDNTIKKEEENERSDIYHWPKRGRADRDIGYITTNTKSES